MSTAQAHVYVSGRVQGVFYRAFTRGIAQQLGLTGWVRNLYDGRVEAVFEGDKARIEKAIAECAKGPPSSYVENVDVSWLDYSGAFKGFEIRH